VIAIMVYNFSNEKSSSYWKPFLNTALCASDSGLKIKI